MKRLIRVSGYIIDEHGEHLAELQRLAKSESARHWKMDFSEDFDEDKNLADKNCDLAHLEYHFVERRYESDGERELPKAGEIWKHFKGKSVTIIAVAKFSEDATKRLVVYDCPNGVYARPLDMFMSKVDKFKYPNAEQIYRFERVNYGGTMI